MSEPYINTPAWHTQQVFSDSNHSTVYSTERLFSHIHKNRHVEEQTHLSLQEELKRGVEKELFGITHDIDHRERNIVSQDIVENTTKHMFLQLGLDEPS